MCRGTKIAVVGRLQTGSYTNREGLKVYTTDVVIEEQEFAESKQTSDSAAPNMQPRNVRPQPMEDPNGFMMIPDGSDDDLPFS